MRYIIITILCTFSSLAFSQGPPITGDKPVMLGQGTKLIKTLTEIRKTEGSTIISAPVMFHYLPSSNMLLGIHVPFVNISSNLATSEEGGLDLGDIGLLYKYQFHRKDEMGKTLRMVLKTYQNLPTGRKLFANGISTGNYESYLAWVTGYETIKYGISNELGINIVPDQNYDEFRYKLGFGLPLLKPAYPVNQINLYFEYQSSWFYNLKEYMLMYAQGIQYAKGRITIETSIQLPLVEDIEVLDDRKFSVFLGMRYIL